MEKFDWFVLPFTLGLLYLVVTLVVTYSRWIAALPSEELAKVRRGVLSRKSIEAMGEIFLECLLHRKIFRVNPLLGYMHASLAFGWFLLILIGNWESRIFYHGHISPPYVPIFFRFFNPNPGSFEMEGFFSFIMDFILLVVLSGVTLAWVKRFRSRIFGMKKTTQLRMGDKFALGALWFIFPLRFLAESFASGTYGGGHFLTSNAGSFFASFLPVDVLVYPAWWAYSFALGTFFVALPFSRYMHIPTEVILIFLRKYGVKEQAYFTSFTQAEVKSCSSCGVCIDRCQMASSANIRNTQSSYFLKSVRNQSICDTQSLNCLMCGRCDSICPVGVDIKSIRAAARTHQATQKDGVYQYITKTEVQKAEVLYFAGCMTHLQPSIKKSMVEIMRVAGENFTFMDEQGSICCGRPLMLAGKHAQARELMAKNAQMIADSGAKTLVTSCPICYKVFKDEYNLNIEVLHHSQYLLNLIENGKIEVTPQKVAAVYHDPCELGRGSGIYKEPRSVIAQVADLQTISQEKEDALCCGGSLANLKIAGSDRKKITEDAIQVLTQNKPDTLVTGCPLCKKTFAASAPVRVQDIAELVVGAIKHSAKPATKAKKATEKNLVLSES
jgi:Fe-S oxidoreductase